MQQLQTQLSLPEPRHPPPKEEINLQRFKHVGGLEDLVLWVCACHPSQAATTPSQNSLPCTFQVEDVLERPAGNLDGLGKQKKVSSGGHGVPVAAAAHNASWILLRQLFCVSDVASM